MRSRRPLLLFASVIAVAALPLVVLHQGEVQLVAISLILGIGALLHRARLARL